MPYFSITSLLVVCYMVFALNSAALAQDTPAINCGKAESQVDDTICQSQELMAMDRDIAALYDEARANADPSEKEDILNDQRAFLARREACVEELNSAHPGVGLYECIRNIMQRRSKALRHLTDE